MDVENAALAPLNPQLVRPIKRVHRIVLHGILILTCNIRAVKHTMRVIFWCLSCHYDNQDGTMSMNEFLERARILGQAVQQWRAEQQSDPRISGPMRNVLERLYAFGSLPVPGIARLDGVSRQHIQHQVDRLLDLGYVARRSNPAHRRSDLIALTVAGRAWVQDVRANEERVLARLQVGVSDAAVRDAARVLGAWRDALTTVHSEE